MTSTVTASRTWWPSASSGTLLLYPGIRRTGGYGAGRVVGHGWQTIDRLLGVGDWNGDGKADLIGRERRHGHLWLYPGPGRAGAGFATRTRAGTGFGGFGSITAAGDVNGDHHPDIVVHKGDGILRLYPGNGRGGFLSPSTVGHGWRAPDRARRRRGLQQRRQGRPDRPRRRRHPVAVPRPGTSRGAATPPGPGPAAAGRATTRSSHRATGRRTGARTCWAARRPTTRCGCPTATGAAASSAAAASAPAGDPADRSRGRGPP